MGLATEEISAIAVDPSDENTIYAGSSSDFSAGTVGGLFKSTDGGAVWDTLIRGITVVDIDIHPFNSQILYVTAGINFLTPAGIYKTTNGGLSWTTSDSGIIIHFEEGPMVLAIDPLYPDNMYVGTSGVYGGKFYKSIDGGYNWQIIDDEVLTLGVVAIAIDPISPTTLYAGTTWLGALCKSHDGGENWQQLDFPSVGIIYDLHVHPLNPDTVYVGTKRHGFYSINEGGTNYQENNIGLNDTTSIRKILISDDNRIFIAANNAQFGAVYKSDMDNIEWSLAGDLIFDQGVQTIAYSPISNQLLLGTLGLFKLSLPLKTTIIQNSTTELVLLKQNYPNPFNSKTYIEYSIKSKSIVTLSIYDIKGCLISTIVNTKQVPGQYKILYNPIILASGSYFYRLSIKSIGLKENYFYSKQFTILR